MAWMIIKDRRRTGLQGFGDFGGDAMFADCTEVFHITDSKGALVYEGVATELTSAPVILAMCHIGIANLRYLPHCAEQSQD